jgi:hypothetical protein
VVPCSQQGHHGPGGVHNMTPFFQLAIHLHSEAAAAAVAVAAAVAAAVATAVAAAVVT